MSFIINEDVLSLGSKVKKLVFSEKKIKDYEYSKITARPFQTKKGLMWQLERFKNNQVFHENMSEEAFLLWLTKESAALYRQCCLTAEGTTVHYNMTGDKIKRKVTGNAVTVTPQSHNKEKEYILKQGENIPALVDLGVFSRDFKIIKSKFRTIS